MKKFLRVLKSIIFLGILIFACLQLNNLFIRKSLSKPWDMGNKIGGFFNESEDYKAMFFGTSHAYCSFEPLYIYEKTGMKSYVLSSQKQPLKITATYVKEALKRKNPEVIFVDIYGGIFKITEDLGVVNSYSDYLPMSLNKLKMVGTKVPRGFKATALFPLVAYHSRWDDLKDEDYHFDKKTYEDYLKGYVLLKGQSQDFKKDIIKDKENFLNSVTSFDEEAYLKENLKSIDEIIETCQKNGAQVYFVKTPIYSYSYYSDNIKVFKKYLEDRGAKFIDFNEFYHEMGLHKDDFYDPHHLNVSGAEKFNDFFIDYMKREGVFQENLAKDKSWLEDLKTYNINKS